MHATLDGHRFDTVVEPDGRRGHWVRVGADIRGASGLGPGDTAQLTLEVADRWPEPEVPDDLAGALSAAPERIRETWQDITALWPGGSGCAGCRRPAAPTPGSAASR